MLERSEYGGRERRLAPVALALCVSWLASVSAATAEGWCDLVFKDVVESASNVIIAHYQKTGKSEPSVTVVEVLKGGCTDDELDMDLEELGSYRLKDGDRLVLALTSYHQPIRLLVGLGGCTPVSILPIRGGKLRARERADYDLLTKSITLEALRSELVALIEAGP